MEAYFLTDQGQVRGHNEDSGGIYYNSSGQLLAVIADGMGGHQAGDIASEMAVSIIQQSWKESKELKDPEETETWLSHILFYVNNEIYRLKSKENTTELKSRGHLECCLLLQKKKDQNE